MWATAFVVGRQTVLRVVYVGVGKVKRNRRNEQTELVRLVADNASEWIGRARPTPGLRSGAGINAPSGFVVGCCPCCLRPSDPSHPIRHHLITCDQQQTSLLIALSTRDASPAANLALSPENIRYLVNCSPEQSPPCPTTARSSRPSPSSSLQVRP